MTCRTVKRLELGQLPRIHRLGKMFADEVKLPGGYNPEAHDIVWDQLMKLGLGEVFYTEDESGELTSMLGASYVPDLYSGLAGAQMQWVYVDPQHRSGSTFARLFAAFEAEAEKRGTVKFTAGHKVGIHEDMGKFFARRGYVPGEVFYWKNLCQSQP